MENGKKNTVVLTIIAIATLVVAVVGATFAYYSVDTRNNTTTTTFTATGNPIGAITLTSPNTTLEMTLTPTDFAQFSADKHYYALIPTATNEAPTTSNGRYGTSKKAYTMAQADLVGGNTETGYTCTAQLKVTLTTTAGTMGNVLKAGDAILYFTTDQTTMDTATAQTLDLSTIVASGSKTYAIVYKVNGKDANTRQAYIKADLEINNDVDRDQTYLAGTSLGAGKGSAGATLTVKIESLNLNCVVDQVKAS